MKAEFEKLSDVSLSEIIDLVNDVFADYVIPIKWDVLSFELDMKENSISLEDSYIMKIDGEKIGFCVNALRPHRARIDAFGIKRDYRGKGFGSALLDYSIDSLKWKKAENISLEVAEKDMAASFYEKHGFRVQRTLISYYVDKKVEVEPYNFEKAVVDEIYDMAVFNMKEKLRFPNWQREPITLKLSDGRYNHNFLKDGSKNCGYAVWGANKEGAYVIDAAPRHFEKYDEFFKKTLSSIQNLLSFEKIIIMNVPEDDPLSDAALSAEMNPFFRQWEMIRF